MKTCIKLIIIATVINPTIVLAAANQYTKVKSETPITCPTQIDCSRDKSISSCKPVGGNPEYWGEIGDNGNPVRKGTYFFSGAFSHYQAPYSYDESRCEYTQIVSNFSYTLQLRKKEDSEHLEALPGTSTKWRVGGYYGSCNNVSSPSTPIDPQVCPLDKEPLVSITLNSINYITLSAYANGILITKQPIYSQQPVKINLYQAWDACSDQGQCTINFIAQAGGATFDVGNIIVDMDNKIKILQVNSLPSSGYEIVRKEDVNAVEVKDTTSNN